MNGFYSNNGASTSSTPFANQISMNLNPQLAGSLPLRELSALHHPHQQSEAWSPEIQMTQPQMAQNIQNPPQFQQQQQWMGQQNQSFPPGINAATGFNMQYLPPQVLQDAIALSAPVKAADEPLLIQHILDGLKRGDNYKVILNGLHGKRDHSASLWKDYYLENKTRIDGWISMCLQSSTPTELSRQSSAPAFRGDKLPTTVKAATIKKPSPSSFRIDPVPSHSASVATASSRKFKVESAEPRTTPQVLAQAAGSRRPTINSLTVGSPVFDKRLPPPHAEIKIPEPPSRSPSPPTIIIPKGRGNKYTNEDAGFFIKFIQWHLKSNPDLTRQDLCEMLAEKAPHHTSQSWASYWSLHHDLPDKILAAARGEDSANGDYQSNSDSGSGNPPSRKRPRYKELTTSEEESSEDEAHIPVRGGKRKMVAIKKEDDEDDDCTPIRAWKESDMGSKGGAFTEADMYITACYIRDFPNWASATFKDRWTPFAQKYPQRSAKSWGEYYRRYETEIDRLVHRIQNERKKGIARR